MTRKVPAESESIRPDTSEQHGFEIMIRVSDWLNLYLILALYGKPFIYVLIIFINKLKINYNHNPIYFVLYAYDGL